MIHDSGSGFWEKTLALPEDRCFLSVSRTKELILLIATSSQLLSKSVFGLKICLDLNQRIQNSLCCCISCSILIVSSFQGIPHVYLITWWWIKLSMCWMCSLIARKLQYVYTVFFSLGWGYFLLHYSSSETVNHLLHCIHCVSLCVQCLSTRPWWTSTYSTLQTPRSRSTK